jgi:opacity protein-like surface antigen
MKKILLLLVPIIPYMSLADELKIYIDMNPMMLNYSDNGTTTDFKPTGFKWTAGYLIKDFNIVTLGLEASFMTGVESDSKTNVKGNNGVVFNQASSNLDKMYSLYLKTIVPITGGLNANLYVGGSRAKMVSSAIGFSSSNEWDSSLSYGAGLEYWSSANVSVYGN